MKDEKLNEAIEIIKSFTECPLLVDEATRAESFDLLALSHRVQLVVNMSCSFQKIWRARRFLSSFALGEESK